MIGFFRRIRKQLADDNKLLKYLRYAIGEIVLVAIGILLALQVNNWNVNRLKHAQEIQLLKRISEDLKNDTIYYSDRIVGTKRAIKEQTKYIIKSYEHQNNLEEAKDLISSINFETDHLTTSNSTYREMISTGSINHIQDEFLKKMIIDYYRVNEEIGVMIEEFNTYSTDVNIITVSVVPNLIKIIDSNELYDNPSMSINTKWKFLNNSESDEFMALESLVNVYLTRNIEHFTYFQKLLSHSKALHIQVNEAVHRYE